MARTLLIVDDVGANRAMLNRILCEDYELLEAENGRAALEVLRSCPSCISAVLLDLCMPEMDGFELLELVRADEDLAQIPVIVTTGQTEAESEARALAMGANDYITKPFNPAVIRRRLSNAINLREAAAAVNELQRDRLTGLYNREAFLAQADKLIAAHEPGYFVMACFDIDNFKVINDQYGTEKGDQVLRHAASCIDALVTPMGGLCCRVMADNFAILYPSSLLDTGLLEENHRKTMTPDCIGRTISIRIGRYIVTDLSLSASAMYDRATLAEISVRGKYGQYTALYDESMRRHLLMEQQIVNEMDAALSSGQFEPWFQPQYNHATGALIGAEALVRWRHPDAGLLVPPGDFIPVFERNGFIYEMDKHIWERVCVLLRRWIDQGLSPLPVSVNISRHDFLREDLYDVITGLIEKHSLPVALLRLEVTESAFANSGERIVTMVRKLMDYGFTVEIDDFGSGYSSLNTLKDVPATILKLDMKFLETSGDTKRGGNILESIVRMAKWLGMSVIAEGVETRTQADYLKSIGCNYVQGYFYARPMPLEQYEALAVGSAKESEMLRLETVETLDNSSFWDPKSMDTLIFNSYIGGACIFEYYDGKTELLRINERYTRELGVEYERGEPLSALEPELYLDEENLQTMRDGIEKAISTGRESTCELFFDDAKSGRRNYIRSTVCVLARAGDRRLCYSTVINMVAEKEAERELRETDEQLRFLNETAHELLAQPDSEKGIEIVLQKLLDYFDGSRAYVYEADPSGKSIVNTYEVCAPGVSPAKARVKSVPSGERETWFDAFSREGRVGTDGLIAVPLRRDGSLIGCIGVDSPRRQQGRAANLNALGDYIAVMLTRRDLDARIKNDNEALLSLMNDTPGGFIRMRANPGERVQPVYLNDGFCKLVGMSRTELAEMYAHDVFAGVHPDDLPVVRDAISLMRSSGEIHNLKFRLLNGSGEYFWIIVFGRRTQSEDGQVFLNIYYADAAERDKLEEQRRALLENLPCGAGIYEISDGKIRASYINRRYRNYLHREIGELSAAPVFEVVHPDDRAKLAQQLQKALANHSQESCDIRIMDGSGDYIPFSVIGTVAEHSAQRSVIYVTYTPISKEELTARDTLPYILSAIMKSTTDLSFAKDKDYRYICCSRGFAEMIGLDDESEVVGKTDYDLFTPDIADKYRADDIKLTSDGQSIVDKVERIPSCDGVAHYSNTSKYLLYDTVGNIIGLYGTGRDITEYRTAFERLKLLTNSIPGGLATYELSPKGLRLRYFSDGYCAHTGYTRDEYTALCERDSTSLVFPGDVDTIRAVQKRVLDGEDSFSYEYRSRSKDGGYRWLNVQGVVIERSGERAVVNVVKLDITTRKFSEEKLRMSEEQYRLAQKQSGNIMCRYDVADRSVNMSAEVAAMFAMPEKVLNVPYAPVSSGRIAPESTRDYIVFYESILNGQKTGSSSFKAMTAEGWRWLEARYSTIFSDTGAPAYAVISFADITEQREQLSQTEALRENEQVFKTVAAHSSRMIFRYDIASRTAYADLTDDFPQNGIHADADSPASLIPGWSVLPDSLEEYKAIFKAITEKEAGGEAKIHMRSADDAMHWLDLRYSTIRSFNGAVKSAVISLLDITDAHEKELAYQRFLESVRSGEKNESIIYFDTDLTADVVESVGGSIHNVSFPDVGCRHEDAVNYGIYNLLSEEYRARGHAFFSREHLITCFSDGVRNLSEDWPVALDDGPPSWFRSSVQMMQDPYSGHIRAYTSLQDITEEKRAALDTRKLAELDGMTGVYNRTTAESIIMRRLSEGDGRPCTLIVADLDDLKSINDTLGHPQGDKAIRQLAAALKSQFRHTDVVGRIGGDEFIVFLDGIGERNTAEELVNALLGTLSGMRIGENDDIPVLASLGVALSASGLDSFEELYSRADKALYRAKRGGKQQFAFYSPDMA